jgi:hypothetical protein
MTDERQAPPSAPPASAPQPAADPTTVVPQTVAPERLPAQQPDMITRGWPDRLPAQDIDFRTLTRIVTGVKTLTNAPTSSDKNDLQRLADLALERREEGFHHRVVVRVAAAGHAAGDAVRRQHPLVLLAGVRRALIGVMKEPDLGR